MAITLSILLIVLGFGLLIKGADWMVTGASALAKKKNISDLAIGLTVVAFGTSAPELVVNAIASSEGYADITFGNVLGSNNFNLFAILGVVGLILPLKVQASTAWKEIPISFFALCVVFLLANEVVFQPSNIVSQVEGLFLLLLFGAFLAYVFFQMKATPVATEIAVESPANLKIGSLILFGLAGLILGGKLVVDNAVDIAAGLGVSEKIIGLTIIAAGTSLPELVTSVVAALRKNSDMAIGNIIGSNIFNLLLVLSVSSMIAPLDYNPTFNTDMYLLGGGTIFLFLAMFTGKKKTLDRWEAGVLLVVFVTYTASLIGQEL
ncbi:calcium/sodium antiporter [Neolewinella antarctica]|uniref:Cation:H+ antiporter n=1 Tax=Neolewinella antarctica TaxID=442734 RepID=A0ABX0XDP6_9BACT|nr:calcium/sodium antiporter [Neolewinella antarctica]NJC27428.1 cation:H+ antiporter [Neolewinella antarctica]